MAPGDFAGNDKSVIERGPLQKNRSDPFWIWC